MTDKSKSTSKPRRPRVPQRYYYAGDILTRVFRWHHIRAMRGHRWSLTFRVKALAKLAGIPAGEDLRDTYLDALAALQQQGRLDDPEVQKHADALRREAERVERFHKEDQEREEQEIRRRAAPRSVIVRRPNLPRRDDGGESPNLEDLRAALRLLEESGEASAESAIFRLRREIHDLEHTREDDDWSAWEGADAASVPKEGR